MRERTKENYPQNNGTLPHTFHALLLLVSLTKNTQTIESCQVTLPRIAYSDVIVVLFPSSYTAFWDIYRQEIANSKQSAIPSPLIT